VAFYFHPDIWQHKIIEMESIQVNLKVLEMSVVQHSIIMYYTYTCHLFPCYFPILIHFNLQGQYITNEIDTVSSTEQCTQDPTMFGNITKSSTGIPYNIHIKWKHKWWSYVLQSFNKRGFSNPCFFIFSWCREFSCN